VSGTVQIINEGKVVQTFPLIVSKDSVSKGNMLYVGVRESSDAMYLGKNTAKFVEKIGPSEFTGTGEFTLTQQRSAPRGSATRAVTSESAALHCCFNGRRPEGPCWHQHGSGCSCDCSFFIRFQAGLLY
jgi:hypothetical protein